MTKLQTEFDADESSFVREVKYDLEREVLEVRLEQDEGEDRVYFYEDVPQSEYDNLIEAESKGRYFNKQIKDNYDSFEA